MTEILHLTERIQKLKQVLVIHCHRHQRGNSPSSQGNCRADGEAKEAALMPTAKVALVPSLTPSNIILRYLTSKENWEIGRGATEGMDGWWHIDQKLLINLSDQWKIIKGL